MHTSYLPSGQRSRLKEVIQMQISSDINPRRRRDNLFSAFRASQGQRVRLHLFVLPSLVWFPFFFKGCFLSVYSHCPLCRFTLFFQASVACLAIIDSKSFACPRGDVFESQL